jgi:hypothetical protein
MNSVQKIDTCMLFYHLTLRNCQKVVYFLNARKEFYLGRRNLFVGSEVLTAVLMKSSIFWDIKSCRPLEVKQRYIPGDGTLQGFVCRTTC